VKIKRIFLKRMMPSSSKRPAMLFAGLLWRQGEGQEIILVLVCQENLTSSPSKLDCPPLNLGRGPCTGLPLISMAIHQTTWLALPRCERTCRQIQCRKHAFRRSSIQFLSRSPGSSSWLLLLAPPGSSWLLLAPPPRS
jgi:hypothetical protein